MKGERLELRSKLQLVIENTHFRIKGINKFILQRIDNRRLEEKNDGLCDGGKECSGWVIGFACS